MGSISSKILYSVAGKFSEDYELCEMQPLQLKFLKPAKDNILAWAEEEGIKLAQVEFVVPFVLTDKSLSVWLFFDLDETLWTYSQNEVVEKVKANFFRVLDELGYPGDYAQQVSFQLDSDENVQKNYEGSYFYRLR